VDRPAFSTISALIPLRDDGRIHTVVPAEIAADADWFTTDDHGIAIIRPLSARSVQSTATVGLSR